jgi:diguanylate cyclase (GGDEF)-like protein/PAS domain S-box-containing protein
MPARMSTPPALTRFGWLLVGAVLTGNAAAIGLGISNVLEMRRHYIHQAEATTQNSARALDSAVSNAARSIDLSLLTIADQFERLGARGHFDDAEANTLLAQQIQHLGDVDGIRVTDETGAVRWGTGVVPEAHASYADRSFFSQLRDHPQAGPVVTPPLLGRVSGKWIVAFVRRYNRPDGAFGGIISTAVPVTYFGALLSQQQLGAKGTTLIRDRSMGGLIARYPPLTGVAGEVGNTRYSKELGEVLKSGVSNTTFYTPSGADGVARIASFRKLTDVPFFVIAGMSPDEFLDQWQKETWLTAKLLLAFLAVTSISGWLIWRIWQRLAVHATQLTDANMRLRRQEDDLRQLNADLERRVEERTTEVKLAASIVENTAEGALITDERSIILSVNPAFTAITGYDPAEVIGKTPAILRSHHHGQDFYRVMWHRLRNTGHWQGEIWNRRKNGEAYLELLTINAIKNDGAPVRYVGVFSDITDRYLKDEQIRHLAFHDSLTGLPNRLLFEERLQHAVARAQRDQEQLAVAFIDLDGFKQVNDTLGHDVGDLLLKEVATRIRNRLRRDVDTVARLGGDEFIVLLEDIRAPDDCAQLAADLIADLSRPVLLKGQDVQVGASIGIAVFPRDGNEGADLIKRADMAMYEAKTAGKSSYRFA